VDWVCCALVTGADPLAVGPEVDADAELAPVCDEELGPRYEPLGEPVDDGLLAVAGVLAAVARVAVAR